MSSPHPPAALPTLADAVRRLLAEEGRPPSRRRVEAFIAAGAVSVEGRVVRDPATHVATTARIALDLDAAYEARGAAREPGAALAGAPGAAARPVPPGLLHADGQLVVADRGAFPAGADEALAEGVAAALATGRGRLVALHAVADPSAPGSGPVLLGTSRTAARHLAEAVRDGAARETLLALRSPPVTGPSELVLERGEADLGGGPLAWALVQREDAPLGPPPGGARNLVPPHRLLLTMKHPKTNRRLTFACDPSDAFSAACARLLGGPRVD